VCLSLRHHQGIGTSLGVFANILVSMNDEDFEALKNNPDIDLVPLPAPATTHRDLTITFNAVRVSGVLITT